MKLRTWLGMALVALAAGMASADGLEVSAYWQDHMVLQRGKPITVWGKDAPGRVVTISFTNQAATATTDADGYWETTFAQPFALSAAPQTLTISNDVNEVLSISDVLVGDVFLAAGQSNMDRRLEDLPEPQSIKDFCRDDDGIRFIRIARSCENSGAGEELFDLPPHKAVDVIANPQYHGMGHDWSPATGDDRNYVSSVALNFAHYIRRSNEEKGQNIPIGIIHASSGGTAIRWWLSNATLSANNLSFVSNDALYWNVMMAPILRAKFCAILWYQGCSDGQRGADEYKALMDVLVQDRRDRWGENGDLPFYAVQIASAGYYGPNLDSIDHYPAPTEDPYESNYVRIREAQRLWDASDAGTHGLVTIVDCVPCLGAGDLHPKDKNFVGRRLSLLARRDIYGETDLQAEGPVFTRAVREANGAVRVFFRSGTAKGLTAGRMKPATDIEVSRWVKKGSDPIRGFAICGADGAWKEAEATVEGETVVLRADGVASPTKFHYGYWSTTRITELEDGQRLNLYNGDGLPMSPVAPQAVEDPDASGKVADPVLTPASCFFSPSTNVTIACATTGATVRYTLDGSEPTASSAIYSAPIALTTNTTVKARAFAEGKAASDVVFATYTLGEPPAQEPDPQWEPGVYKFAEWTPLANNLLAGLTTAYTQNSLDPWNGSVVCLTDGTVSSDLDDDTVGIGIRDGATLSWSFADPKTIETIRLTACGYNHMYKYDKILVESVEVLQDGEWNQIGGRVAFNGLDSYGSDQSLYVSLADEVTGRLATNVTGLRITFGNPKSLDKCRYAEIEASGYDSSGGPTETVATPAFYPAACSFFPSTNVALSCATEGATIRYTLDGSVPTVSSTPYSTPIPLSATTTVKARAFADGMNPSAVATATYTYVDPAQPTYDIAIAACENGTLETSVTNDIPAGTVVTVTATPAAGYRLASVTTNGAALAGTTFAMPAGDVTLAATFAEQGAQTHLFYVGGTGYDTWAAAMNAASPGDTVSLGADAEISGTQLKSLTIDLRGHTLTANTSSAPYIGNLTISVTDSVGDGLFTAPNGMNLQGSIDLSALAHDQFSIAGNRFWTGSGTIAKFPAGWTLDECKATFRNFNNGAKIVAQGVTYTFDGTNWVSDDPGHDITITAPQNGTLQTSVTNNVAAGTTVTVTATPAAGYQLVSVTTNGTALAGNTFTMPSANVTVAATFEETEQPPYPPPSGDKLFYIGETGYDSWADAYAAVVSGGTITVGANADISGNVGKTFTLDLCGRTLGVAGGWMFGTVTVVDSGVPAGSGQFKIPDSPNNMNVQSGTLDLSSLTAAQLTGTGRFWTNAGTVLKFPGDMPLESCAAKIANASEGQEIVVQGATYRWNGVDWVPEGHDITIEAPQNGTLETSATNNVAAGTVVTVTATPAAGYRLASVTTNGAALAGATFEMPDENVTVAATFEEEVVPPPPSEGMFFIGETGYDSWTNAFAAATNGATIVVGKDAVIYQPNGTINKSITIDLCGRTLTHTQGWLMNASVAVVDTGSPNGRFDFSGVSRLNISRGLLDLSALADGQVDGMFQMSATSLLRFPSDQPFDACTNRVAFDAADPAHGVGARIVVQGVTYTWNGSDWGVAGYPAWLPTDPDSRAKYDLWSTKNGVADPATAEKDAYLLNCENTPDAIAAARAAFRIASIFVHPNDDVDLGLSPAPEGGYNGTVVILGCATVDGTYLPRPDATTEDGAMYRVPASDDRFFQAALDL